MEQKCSIPALVMARGTKGLSAQYKKEMSRINRLTYGARKRGYTFDIPFRETRYGLSKLRQITSVKQLYKYSTKIMASPISGEIKEYRGDLAREFERTASARQAAITRELKKQFGEREDSWWDSVNFKRRVAERAHSTVRFAQPSITARQIVKESIQMEDWIDTVNSTQYEEPIVSSDDIDELFNDLKSNPPEPQIPPEGIDFEDEEPITSNQPEVEEEPAMDYDTAEQWVDEFMDEARFHDTRVYWAVKDLIDKAIDDYDIFTVANRLQAAYADGVMQKLYEQSKPKEEGAVDTTELEEYLNASPSSERLEDLSDGYDPFAGQSDSQNFYDYYG